LSEAANVFDSQWHPTNIDDANFVSQAYVKAFGFQPGLLQVQHFRDQLEYFQNLYESSGAFGSDITRIEILARGAIFGQMLGIGVAPVNNALAASNLIDENSISTVGGLTTVDFELN
jgi:hypothetical protein